MQHTRPQAPMQPKEDHLITPGQSRHSAYGTGGRDEFEFLTQASGPVLPYDRKLAKLERKMQRKDLKHVRPYRRPRRLYPNEESENEEEPNKEEEEVNLTWDDDFSPMPSNAEQEDSLVDHFDSDFLNEVPRMNGIPSNQM